MASDFLGQKQCEIKFHWVRDKNIDLNALGTVCMCNIYMCGCTCILMHVEARGYHQVSPPILHLIILREFSPEPRA